MLNRNTWKLCNYVLKLNKWYYITILARPPEEVHWRTSLISFSVLLQQCSTCLVRLTWIVLEMGGKWPYSSLFMGCCFQCLFKIVQHILLWFPSSFFSIRLVSVHFVHPFSRIDTTAGWKKSRFISWDRLDFLIIVN